MQRSSVYPLLLVVATILVFGRIATHDFTYWDDSGTIHHNPRLNPPSVKTVGWYWSHSELGLYIPVTYTAWGILASAARLDAPDEFDIALNPWLFHAASLIVHLGSVLLVFRILRRLIGRDGPSFAGALLFAIHPLQTETVAWASGLKDLLCGFFALLAIWEYMKFVDESSERRRLHYVLAIVAFILSMLSKATGMLTPVLAGIIVYWGLRRPVDVVKSPLICFAWLVPAAVAIAIWRVRKTQPLLVAAGLLFVAGLLPVVGPGPVLL